MLSEKLYVHGGRRKAFSAFLTKVKTTCSNFVISNGFCLSLNNEGFVQLVSLNICPCAAQRRFIRKFEWVLCYSLRTVEPAGSSLVPNNMTGFWRALLVRNVFSPWSCEWETGDRWAYANVLVFTLNTPSLFLTNSQVQAVTCGQSAAVGEREKRRKRSITKLYHCVYGRIEIKTNNWSVKR